MASDLVGNERELPELILDNVSVGRGRTVTIYEDGIKRRYDVSFGEGYCSFGGELLKWRNLKGRTFILHFQVNTISANQYLACESQTSAIPVTKENFGTFSMSACYIVEWTYRLSTVGVRTLTGEESTKGRWVHGVLVEFRGWVGVLLKLIDVFQRGRHRLREEMLLLLARRQ